MLRQHRRGALLDARKRLPALVSTHVASGMFTFWSGTTFNFDSVREVHARAIRVMRWSRSKRYLLTADDTGEVFYWLSSGRKDEGFSAHSDIVRGLSFAPTDHAFASCADDGVVKVWDFWLRKQLCTLKGHHNDVRSVSWHPESALVASGSRDSTVKLWDPSAGVCATTLRLHTQTVHKVEWHSAGHWLLTASQDRSIAVWDLRMLREFQVVRPRASEPVSIAWHPDHEALFAVGHLDGELSYWIAGASGDEPAAMISAAHDGAVWDMAWHPLGHVLATASNDHFVKFWGRPRPGDTRAQYEYKGSERRQQRDSMARPPAAAAAASSSSLLSAPGGGGGAMMSIRPGTIASGPTASTGSYDDQFRSSTRAELRTTGTGMGPRGIPAGSGGAGGGGPIGIPSSISGAPRDYGGRDGDRMAPRGPPQSHGRY